MDFTNEPSIPAVGFFVAQSYKKSSKSFLRDVSIAPVTQAGTQLDLDQGAEIRAKCS